MTSLSNVAFLAAIYGDPRCQVLLKYFRKTVAQGCNPASKVVQIRAALVPVPSPDKWGGLRQEGHPA